MLSPHTPLRDSSGALWIVRQPVPDYEGSLYTCHHAEDPATERWLRFVPTQLDPSGKVPFQRRASAICGYRHPAAPRGLAWGVDDRLGVRFLVMEPVYTTSLDAHIRHGSTPTQITLWFEQLGRALSQLHQQGIPHCDLRLERVGIDEDGLVTLGPWGFPLPRDPSTIPEGTPLPTSPASLGPEALVGPDASPRASDVYGFGQLLHEALTATPAFLPNHPASLAHAKHAMRSLDPGPHTPASLRAVVQLATSADPRQRPDMPTLMQSYHPPTDNPNQVETDWVPMAVRRQEPLPDAPTERWDLDDIASAVVHETTQPTTPAPQIPSPQAPRSGRPWVIAMVVGGVLGLGAAAVTVAGLTAAWFALG